MLVAPAQRAIEKAYVRRLKRYGPLQDEDVAALEARLGAWRPMPPARIWS